MAQYSYTMQPGSVGMLASQDLCEVDSYVNELLKQITTITVGAAPGAGTYTIQIEGEEGTFQLSYVSPGGETEAQIVAGLLAALNSDPDLLGLVTGADASPDLVLTFDTAGRAYVVTATSNPGGALTLALTQAAGGDDAPLGVGVVAGSSGELVKLPDGGTVAADMLGITVRSLDADVLTGDPAASSVFAPGSTVSVLEKGEIWVRVEDAVTFNGDVFMRIQNPAAGLTTGTFRSNNAGGDAIQIPGAVFRSSTSAAGLAVVKINRP